ncbi:MAG: oxidoreductase [Desulfuromonas sp.]|nr:MAG: oxidoreductase [Desulfuromonas sp.]
MSAKHQTWGWMLAVDFFFAGMGGAMLVIAGLADLFVGRDSVSLLGSVVGPLAMCVGCGFLILELGRPLQAWRVFMNPKAILTFGAWMMTFAIIFGFIFASFAIDFSLFFWRDSALLRHLVAILMVVTGLIVATYPGVLLARHKGRPFWVGPGIMGLFLLSSLVTAFAAHYLCGLIVAPRNVPYLWEAMPYVLGALLFAQGLLWCGYLWIKLSGTSKSEAASAKRWISGDQSQQFKLAFLFFGTVAPLILTLIPLTMAAAMAAVLALFGGVTMRLLTVNSGNDRTMIPGEAIYRSRLPKGHEKFLGKAWL